MYPVVFNSKKHFSSESNYEIYYKELKTSIRAFNEWRLELQSIVCKNSILVFPDHRNLKYFMRSKTLSRLPVICFEILSGFNFEITYPLGKARRKPDALTRQDHRPLGETQKVDQSVPKSTNPRDS